MDEILKRIAELLEEMKKDKDLQRRAMLAGTIFMFRKALGKLWPVVVIAGVYYFLYGTKGQAETIGGRLGGYSFSPEGPRQHFTR